MSQTTTLRALDAAIAGAMLGAGLADDALYTPPGGGAGIPCTVLVDRALQVYGDQGEVVGHRIAITLFLATVPSPARGGTVAIGAEVFRLDEPEARDESMSQWVVVRG